MSIPLFFSFFFAFLLSFVRFNDETQGWEQLRCWTHEDNAHGDWVRDVAWAPSLGLPTNMIASASEDKTVIIWTEDAHTGLWSKSKVLQFDTKCWKVSWSLMGNILAVSQGDNTVSLWKESADGDWKNLNAPASSSSSSSSSSSASNANAAAAPSKPALSAADLQASGF